MLNGLDFIVLHVPDLAEARAFYTEKLGFDVAAENTAMVRFKPNPTGAVFAVEETKDAPPHRSTDLWWRVADADATHAWLLERGVEVVGPPETRPYGRFFKFKDPAGNEHRVLQSPTDK